MRSLSHSTLSRRIAAGVIAVAASFALALPALAATVPTGTQIHAKMISQDIRTNKAHVGDQVIFEVVPPYASKYLSGAKVYGHVSSVRSAGQGRSADMRIALSTIVFPTGESKAISGSITQLTEVKDNTIARKALGAGAGMAVGSQTIGRIIGGGAGGVIGMLGGAAAGLAYASNDKPNFNVAKGASATIETKAPLLIPHKQASRY